MPISKSKQFFFALNTDDTDEFLDTNKGFYREMWNMVPGNEVTSNPSRQSMKSNGAIGIDFNSQENNVCIGTATDTGRNRIVFFIHKPSGIDAIYLWESGRADAVKLLEWSGLNFSEEGTIEHAFIVEDLLYWSQKDNPQRSMSIKRALEGGYVNKEIEINLAKTNPITPPIAVKTLSRDSELTSNRIAPSNYQFAYRYKYKDGAFSPLSLYSKLVRSNINPEIDDPFRSIDVTITIPENLEDYVDEIELLVDENKLSIWKVFHTVENIDTSSSQTITVNFDAQNALITIPEEASIYIIEPIPKRSSAQAFIKNRSIINSFTNGHDESGNYNIELEKLINSDDDPTEWTDEYTLKNRQFHLKSGGGYSITLCFYDEFHRPTNIKKKIPINIPFETVLESAYATEVYRVKRHIAKINIVGTPPTPAKYFSILMTQDFNYDLYMQIPVTILFYVAEYNEGDPIPGDSFKFKNSIYLDEPPSSFGGSVASFVHLLVPQNVPFAPDTSFQVRIMDDKSGSPLNPQLIEPILEYTNNRMVVGNFGIDDWSFLSTDGKATMMVEVYRRSRVVPEEYYEQGEVYPIENFGGTFYVEGDTNKAIGSTIQYAFDAIEALSEGMPSNNYTDNFLVNFPISVEAPTRTFTASNISSAVNAKIEAEEGKRKGFEGFLDRAPAIDLGKYKLSIIRGFAYNFFVKPAPYVFKGYKGFTQVPSKTLDYNKLANNHGRTLFIFEDEEEINAPNLLINSSPYIADSRINGLHSYDPETSYVVPYNRGNLVKMVAANEVLVIIHERNITTMYPGESYVKQGEELTWNISDTFLTQDRQILGKLGSQNPESVIAYDNRVYGLDLYNAEPWRLSNDGITPLASTYKVKRWFIDRCRLYYQEDPLPKIPGGYDPYLDMYFLTFPEIGGNEAVTIGFSEKYDIWIGFYNFIPERYGFVSDNFLSFKNGIPYLHNDPDTSIRNRFYGTDYDSIIKFIVNDNYSQDKIFKAMAIESDKRWKVDCNTPAGQSSRIPSDSFIKRGDHYVSDFYRDENTPTEIIPSGKSALLHGQEMSGPSIEITLTYTDNDDVRLRYVDTRYVVVSGSLLV